MARTIRTKVYKFSELSEEAQQKVIEDNYDINVDHEWWENLYEDAERIGFKITGFDIERGSYVSGDFTRSADYVAEKIIEEHGESCDTHQTAKKFLSERMVVAVKLKFADGDDDLTCEYEGEIEELSTDFEKSICEDYLKLLRQEYEYRTGKEAIKETIESNEYEFTKEGKRF